MFTVQHISKSYDDKLILDDVSLSVDRREVIALVGENGAGKTTLLSIMLGTVQSDAGSILSGNEVIGYVPQNATVGITVARTFKDSAQEWQQEYALSLVGLDGVPLDTPIASLSGGQKTRLALAKVLASGPGPTILLLDEPSNNLDREGLDWLTGFVKLFKGGILLVSHDRTFINNVATSVAELDKGKLRQYTGNYENYKAQKELEHQTAMQQYGTAYAEQQRLTQALRVQQAKGLHVHKHIVRHDHDKYQRDFFRNRVASKLGQNAKAIESRLEQLDVPDKPETAKRYGIALGGDAPSSKLLVRLEAISKSFGKPVLQDVELEIRGSERIHLQGVNGSGKTTFLKIIAGKLQPDSGSSTVGEAVRVGYFSQETDGLDIRVSALENLRRTEAEMTAIYREARALGFTETDLRKPPGQLSRGQQAKLALAKLLLSGNHLLVLDEPTNHMDIPTREKIETALQNYRGALIFSSHDQYFAEAVGTTKQLLLKDGVLL